MSMELLETKTLIAYNKTTDFRKYFLNKSRESLHSYEEAVISSMDAVKKAILSEKQPYSGVHPQEIADFFSDKTLLPKEGKDVKEVIEDIYEVILKNSAFVNDRFCLAHLHCPVVIPTIAAEIIISSLNQSMDSWDQSPSATIIEQHTIDNLCRMFEYPATADGIYTSGGTQSNFMALLLARDNYCQKNLNWSIQDNGLPPEVSKFRIICSEVAHFTVKQSASILGMGYRSVVTIKPNDDFTMDSMALEDKIEELKSEGLIPIAIVATAGTTDFGSIDPLNEIAEIAHKYDIWLHADAAFGGALVMSNKYRHKIAGIEKADSMTVDFHKLFYQPISCSAFLLKDKRNFDVLKLTADYLNPEINEENGIPDLVTKSIQTTKRFDALKTYVAMQSIGKTVYGDMIDYTIDLAGNVAKLIESDPSFILCTQPTINSVVFRYIADNTPENKTEKEWNDHVNAHVKLNLLLSGKAIVGQTVVNGFACLKFTLLNPLTNFEDIEELLEIIKEEAKKI